MMLMHSDFWDYWLSQAKKTKEGLQALDELCETALKTMWQIDKRLGDSAKKRGKVLPPNQSFVWAYFRRNIAYLHSAHILACLGFISPSESLLRTVYETILRSYLFIVSPTEAEQYYSVLKTDNEESFLRKKRYYTFSYLEKELFKSETAEIHRKFYSKLCESAHADIKGALVDFPNASKSEIEDKLNVLAMLSYGNVQMISECFLELFDEGLRKDARGILFGIANTVGEIPQFEPDKDDYASSLRLKGGNFLEIL